MSLKFHEPKKVKLADVNFAPYNPRTIDDEDYAALKASLVEHGVVLHLVVQEHSPEYGDMVLIGGHQRVRAAREVCEEKGWKMPTRGWAVVLDYDDDKAKRLNVALNKIGGDFDAFKLGKLFADQTDMTAAQIIATGFSLTEVDELVQGAMNPDAQAAALEASIGEDLGGFGRSITLTVEFDTAERRDLVRGRLKEIAKKRGVKPGVVLEEAVKLLSTRKRRPRRQKSA